jgi:hypothetical protein
MAKIVHKKGNNMEMTSEKWPTHWVKDINKKILVIVTTLQAEEGLLAFLPIYIQ